MPVFIDQTRRTVSVTGIPQRIISLVPSQTELLFDLGLHDEVIGITKFCVHPVEWFRSKTKIGGTKRINTDLIHQLNPDLIIANKEENDKEQVEELANYFPVWISNVGNLDEAYYMIKQVGLITNKEQPANKIVSLIKENFAELPAPDIRFPTTYLIWKDPYMTIGGDTFIHALLEAAGFENIFAGQTRYPAIRIDDLEKVGCQLLLLSSEPFPFKQKHIEELQAQLPATKIVLVDGEMFSWYGSRLLSAPGYFRKLGEEIKLLFQ